MSPETAGETAHTGQTPGRPAQRPARSRNSIRSRPRTRSRTMGRARVREGQTARSGNSGRSRAGGRSAHKCPPSEVLTGLDLSAARYPRTPAHEQRDRHGETPATTSAASGAAARSHGGWAGTARQRAAARSGSRSACGYLRRQPATQRADDQRPRSRDRQGGPKACAATASASPGMSLIGRPREPRQWASIQRSDGQPERRARRASSSKAAKSSGISSAPASAPERERAAPRAAGRHRHEKAPCSTFASAMKTG